MSASIENKIRARAYELWVAEGCRVGEADRHWLIAERELLANAALMMPTIPAEAKRESRPVTSKTSAAAPALQDNSSASKSSTPKSSTTKPASKAARRRAS
jgi:hypothetical protein